MSKSSVLIAFFLLSVFSFYGQELQLRGLFQGQNLYIVNPSYASNETGFCVKAVYVNEKPLLSEINSNAFEVDFSLMGLDEGSEVRIRIIHEIGCMPEVVNSNVLEISADFTISTPRIDRRTQQLTWSISGVIDDEPFIVEQFRFNKWITQGQLPSALDTSASGIYTYPVNFHSRQNTFRVRHVDKSGIERTSRECRFISRAEEINLLSTRVNEWVYFSGETYYELFDEKGNYVLDGFGRDIDVRELERGRYYLNFDNRTEQISKR